jgi:hypothetical protein
MIEGIIRAQLVHRNPICAQPPSAEPVSGSFAIDQTSTHGEAAIAIARIAAHHRRIG